MSYSTLLSTFFYSYFLGFYFVRTCNFPYYSFTLIPILVFAWDILLNILNDDIKCFAEVSWFISCLDEGLPLVNYSWRAHRCGIPWVLFKGLILEGTSWPYIISLIHTFPELKKKMFYCLLALFVIFGKSIASIIFLPL